MSTIHKMAANEWKGNDVSCLGRKFQTHMKLIVEYFAKEAKKILFVVTSTNMTLIVLPKNRKIRCLRNCFIQVINHFCMKCNGIHKYR